VVNFPRRELEEILTKYELHPTIFDLYVEGEFDRDFVCQFLENTGLAKAVTVLPIDDIDIPAAALTQFGLGTGSNKSRVIALALLLDARLVGRASNVSCLVDSDEDRILSNLRKTPRLLYTDYTSIEMYLFNHPTLARFLSFMCNLEVASAVDFAAVALTVLPVQFAARVVNQRLALKTAVPAFTSGLSKKTDFASFNSTKYINAFIQQIPADRRKNNVAQAVEDTLAGLPRDIRHKSHGHDFLQLLFSYSWDSGGIKLQSKDEDVIKFGGRILSMALQFKELSVEALFERIQSVAMGKETMCELVPQ
jgi:hypothetical protein